ncbi:MAG: DUF4338 domain-containing protein [Acidobacteriia bacterium]|nr:DUF4338 domain-containing protein [Terriglobia bacterium]
MLMGRTTGRGKDDQTGRPNRSIKEVWGYPLTSRFREVLQGVEVCGARQNIWMPPWRNWRRWWSRPGRCSPQRAIRS